MTETQLSQNVFLDRKMGDRNMKDMPAPDILVPHFPVRMIAWTLRAPPSPACRPSRLSLHSGESGSQECLPHGRQQKTPRAAGARGVSRSVRVSVRSPGVEPGYPAPEAGGLSISLRARFSRPKPSGVRGQADWTLPRLYRAASQFHHDMPPDVPWQDGARPRRPKNGASSRRLVVA
jgi:hypothetical protein